MAYHAIRLDMEADVAIVTLDRPKVLNAINVEMILELRDVIGRIGNDLPVRALLLTGNGKAFTAGADLSDPGITTATVLEDHFNPLALALNDLPVPFIAAVNGAAIGVGCSIALYADVVLASRSAYFLQSFSKIGLAPDGGASWTLPRLIGSARASAMLLLGERIGAEQAADWGLIYRMEEADQLLDCAIGIARRMASGPTVALGITRRGLRESLQQDLRSALKREARDQQAASETHDHKEALAAFLEKRTACFTGR